MTAEIARDYARRMFERQHVPLPPLGFHVDWADQPSRHKLYTDTVKVPLPEPFRTMPPVGIGSAAKIAAARPAPGVPQLDVLAAMLGSYGLSGRRTEPNWNDDSHGKLRSDQAVWARPTASGGGMYPAESYLVTGPSVGLPKGVYHYDTAHHGLDRLATTDRRAALKAATGVEADLYAVVTLRFWKNAFKYNSFSYHVVTQDAGALLASWRLVLAAYEIPIEPVLWFDEAAVAAAIGVDGHDEAPFLVVPFGAGAVPDETPSIAAENQHDVWEKSRRVRSFELVSQVHAATLVGDRPRPSTELPETAVNGEPIPLPSPDPETKDLDVRDSLRHRRSSFGLLTARPQLSREDLSWVLKATAQTALSGTDIASAPRESAWIGQHVLASSVAGLERRAYRYDPVTHGLIAGAPIDGGLQHLYALTNYSIPEVAAVVVLTGRFDAMLDAYGARGYRMLSVETGQAGQTAYLAATARGLGIGAVLGLDNLAVDRLLGIEGTGERSMLFLLLGRERAVRLGYDHSLHRYDRSPR
ncbi:SagB/ThcOx family dehydrogenase [Herbidospora sp. RD11066]